MLNLKMALLAVSLLSAGSCSYSQNNTEEKPEFFYIGNYEINLAKKIVARKEGIGGVDWDGFRFVKDTKINFDTTTMVIIDGDVYFKEYLPKEFDFEKAVLLERDGDDSYISDQKFLFRYNTNRNDSFTKIDIFKLKFVDGLLFQNSAGKLFYSKFDELELAPLDIHVDVPTVKHIFGQYYYDKNGLYIFGEHEVGQKFTEKSEMLLKSNGKNILPKITPRYFVYDGAVFANSYNTTVEKIRINPDKMIETYYSEGSKYMLTDGSNMYDSNGGYSNFSRNSSFDFNEYLGSGVEIQKIFKPYTRFRKTGGNPAQVEIVSLNLDETAYTYPEYNLIAKIGGQNYLLYAGDADRTPIKISNLTIYNSESGKMETLDESQFRQFEKFDLFVYKNTAYFDGQEVYTKDWDLKNLREIPGAEYLTDGNFLLYFGNMGGYSIKETGRKEYVDFTDKMVKNIDFPKLKIIGKNILTDGTYLVSGAQKISFADLKLKVEIIE